MSISLPILDVFSTEQLSALKNQIGTQARKFQKDINS